MPASIGRLVDAPNPMQRFFDYRRMLRALVPPMSQIVHACRGESDAAFDWLDRAYRQHDPEMPNIKFDQWFRGLRNDPRFQTLLVKMKLSDDPSTSIR